jgi:hypothetical protein
MLFQVTLMSSHKEFEVFFINHLWLPYNTIEYTFEFSQVWTELSSRKNCFNCIRATNPQLTLKYSQHPLNFQVEQMPSSCINTINSQVTLRYSQNPLHSQVETNLSIILKYSQVVWKQLTLKSNEYSLKFKVPKKTTFTQKLSKIPSNITLKCISWQAAQIQPKGQEWGWANIRCKKRQHIKFNLVWFKIEPSSICIFNVSSTKTN